MGESKLKRLAREEMLMACSGVQTMAGRVQVRWETESAATPLGQLAYFIEFLNLTGLWSRWLESCPLTYTSPNAPTKAEVLGTWLLSMLAGHRRYAHVTTMRCDGINPGLLGMRKVISEDALRNALKRIPETEGVAWLDGHLTDSVAPLLDAPWILDGDTTIKVLYGHQEGALLGYNPKKPGRPSHAYHTYLMAGLRQVLGVEVSPGNEHTARHAQPGLLKLLDALPPEKKPRLVRGDNAFGNDLLMAALEERDQPYLFKLKLSKNVKRHISSLFRQSGWTDAGQGWEGKDGELALTGWEHKRRVVALGARQDSCRLIHAAKGCLSVARDVISTTESRSGLSVTTPMGSQLRVWRDQRFGFRCRASAYSACRAARIARSSPAWRCAGLT